MLLWSSEIQAPNCPDPAMFQTYHLLENKFSMAEVFLSGGFP